MQAFAGSEEIDQEELSDQERFGVPEEEYEPERRPVVADVSEIDSDNDVAVAQEQPTDDSVVQRPVREHRPPVWLRDYVVNVLNVVNRMALTILRNGLERTGSFRHTILPNEQEQPIFETVQF